MRAKIYPFDCEYCDERVSDKPDGAVVFRDARFCSRDCAKEYGRACGLPILPEWLDDVEVYPEGGKPLGAIEARK